MPQYTPEEITKAFRSAWSRMDFDLFVKEILHSVPNIKDGWQLEKWEGFQDLAHAMVKFPEEYLATILEYYNANSKHSG